MLKVMKSAQRTSSLEHPRTQKQNLTKMDDVVDGDDIKPDGNNGWKIILDESSISIIMFLLD
jgi:hypothetical protein